MISRLGHNCCAISNTSKLRFLIDGQEYFDAFMRAADLAEKTLLIVGWEVDSRVKIRPHIDDLTLGDFLDALSRKKPQLKIRILVWDSNFFLSFNRDLLLPVKLGLLAPEGIKLYLVNDHPDISSHHQKIIVVDDSLAMIGGFDLATERWDTPDHIANDPRRVNLKGEPYIGNHDVHVLLAGKSARALGDVARGYWKRCTGEELEPSPSRDIWPEEFQSEFSNVMTSISKTVPPSLNSPSVREIEKIYEESIRSAKELVYVENQYLTAFRTVKALCKVLRKPNGPRVLIVMPRSHYSFLERAALEKRRYRSLRKLERADRYKRFRVMALSYRDKPDHSVKVHSKLLIVDDKFLTVGSANLNNRSMAFDDEANINLEAEGDPAVLRAIRGVRHRLLSEFLGVTPAVFELELRKSGDLFQLLDTLESPNRLLYPISSKNFENAKEIFPISLFGDPYGPLDYEVVRNELLRRVRYPILTHPLFTLAVVVLGLGLIVFLRNELPKYGIDTHSFLQVITKIENLPSVQLYLWITVFLGGMFFLPLNGLIVVSALVFPSLEGYLYTISALLCAMFVSYLIGIFVRRAPSSSLVIRPLKNLEGYFTKRGVMAIGTMRVLPIAPFSQVNVAAGYYGVPLRSYLLGSLLGLLPGTTLIFWLLGVWRHALARNATVYLLIFLCLGILLWSLLIWKGVRAPRKTLEPSGT